MAEYEMIETDGQGRIIKGSENYSTSISPDIIQSIAQESDEGGSGEVSESE